MICNTRRDAFFVDAIDSRVLCLHGVELGGEMLLNISFSHLEDGSRLLVVTWGRRHGRPQTLGGFQVYPTTTAEERHFLQWLHDYDRMACGLVGPVGIGYAPSSIWWKDPGDLLGYTYDPSIVVGALWLPERTWPVDWHIRESDQRMVCCEEMVPGYNVCAACGTRYDRCTCCEKNRAGPDGWCVECSEEILDED